MGKPSYTTDPAAPRVRKCPQGCGVPMMDVTEADDTRLGLRVWLCPECKHEPVEADGQPDPMQARKPTAAPAGSLERVEAYRRRVEQGRAVFHAGDSRARVDLTKGGRRERSLRRVQRDLPAGVCLVPGRRKCYRARVWRGSRADGGYVWLGYYLTAAEAAEAVRGWRAARDDRDLAS